MNNLLDFGAFLLVASLGTNPFFCHEKPGHIYHHAREYLRYWRVLYGHSFDFLDHTSGRLRGVPWAIWAITILPTFSVAMLNTWRLNEDKW